MNEVFLIGKVIEDIEYKFMIKKRKNAKAKIVMLQLMWNKKYSKKIKKQKVIDKARKNDIY